MGCCLSCKSSTEFTNIRVVHLNGYVQEFQNPVSVSQVITGQSPSKNLVFTAAQLLSTESKPLNPDAQLETGQLYFLLPYSILQPDVSPVDFLCFSEEALFNSKVRSWKPVLDTIREQSFNRRSESDLREMDFETPNCSLRYTVFLDLT
ncbi:hypothetical protein OIU78_003334 [Salix suchowensis]|nr:hypothetical protein OIU78_003334 [Salix suchowensis]